MICEILCGWVVRRSKPYNITFKKTYFIMYDNFCMNFIIFKLSIQICLWCEFLIICIFFPQTTECSKPEGPGLLYAPCEENCQDILDQHISRVFDSGQHTPAKSSGCLSPPQARQSADALERSRVPLRGLVSCEMPQGVSIGTSYKHSQIPQQFTVPNSIKHRKVPGILTLLKYI